MRVLYLNPLGQLGGAERSLLNLFRGFSQAGNSVDPVVLTAGEGLFVERLRSLGVPCHVVPFPPSFEEVGDAGSSTAGSAMRRLPRTGCDLMRYAYRLREEIARIEPDLVHTNGFKMHLLGGWAQRMRRSRRPVLAHIHDYVGSRPAAGRALRASARCFDHFVVNSDSVAADVRNVAAGRPVTRVYNAVDQNFSPAGATIDLDAAAGLTPAPPGTVRIGLLATFARWKGHLTFLNSVAQLPSDLGPVRAYIIGGPIYKRADAQFSLAELKAEAARLNLSDRVGFPGFVAEPAEALRALDIVVHASTEREPFGMSIVEGMACGKALVVARAGGAAELFVEGETALGHTPGDVQDLALAITRLVDNSELRMRLGAAAHAVVRQRFACETMAREMMAVYRHCAPAYYHSPAQASGPAQASPRSTEPAHSTQSAHSTERLRPRPTEAAS